MISQHDQQTCEIDALLGRVATEFSERVARGESPDIGQYAEQYRDAENRERFELLMTVGMFPVGRCVREADHDQRDDIVG